MKKWLERRKQGELARVNPTDTIELCKTIRHQQNNKMYDFYLQALTQTGDSHDRRVKIHAQDEEKMNTYCLFCNNEHESVRHIYTCKTVHDMYLRKLQTISQVIDPLDEFKGKLCWFRIDDNRTLSERWASKFKASEREDKVDKLDEKLKAIESHDRFAGMLGINAASCQRACTQCSRNFYSNFEHNQRPPSTKRKLSNKQDNKQHHASNTFARN